MALPSEVDRLFEPVQAAIAPWAGVPAGGEPAAIGGSSMSGWGPDPEQRRARSWLDWRRVRRAVLLLAGAAGALAAAWHVYRVRTEQAFRSDGGELAPSPQRRGPATRAAGDSAALAEQSAATRFAEQRIDESSEALRRSIAAFDAALAGAADPVRRVSACARAESAYVAALASANAITIAERRIGGPLDAARAARVRALSARVEAMPAALRSACP